VKRGITFMLSFAAAAMAVAQPAPNTLTAKERADGWRLLFDGTTTAGWRGYRQETLPSGWQAIDGSLTRVGEAGDIVTADEFGDFELTVEWKLAANGNSGVFFRVVEDDPVMWHMAPEYQVIDNAYKPPLKPGQYAGANYDLDPPSRDATRSIGSWNQTRLLVRGAHVEHWLNGVKVVEYELWTPDWERRVRESKFKDFPSYGRARRGHIGLQDHGDNVAFRNIKIRPYSTVYPGDMGSTSVQRHG
jgi:3-keto-disaccharide hydrolase